jgi:hypothetical protein
MSWFNWIRRGRKLVRQKPMCLHGSRPALARNLPAAAACEPLEQRRLLSVSGPYPITVTVFNDLNRDGIRNSNEQGMAGWGVIAYELRDETGSLYRGSGRTASDGTLTFGDYIIPFESPSARVYIEPHKRYYSTTHQRASSGWFGVSGETIEFGLTDVAPIKGTLLNTYARQDGTTAVTPLAGRRVYEDANLNGRWDRDEKFAVTDLEGSYTMWLRTGTHTLRAELPGGWTAQAGQKLVRTAVVYPYQDFPTFNARMIKPTVIDVLAAYTPAAGDFLRLGANRLDDLFRESNRVYANSNTNVQLNLRAFHRTLYSESGSIETDLRRVQRRGDGFMEDVLTQREQVNADLTVLLTSRDRTDGDVVGLAYQYSTGAAAERFGFSVVTIDAYERGITLAHELGHNLGAGHDAITAEEDNQTPLAPYAYGYRFRAGENRRLFKDIMSYGPGTTLPFFSTPHFKWLGKPIGNSDTADNARIIREVAPLVAAYR